MNNIWTDCSTKCPGIVAAGIFDKEGMMVDGFSVDTQFNLDHAAASFVAVVREARMAGDFLDLSVPDDVQITFPSVYILLRPIVGSERSLTLGLATRSDVPLGRARMYLDMLSKRLPT